MKNNLPQGWVECEMREIGEIVSGGTPSTKDPENFGGKIAWLTPADLSDYHKKYISKGNRNITEKGLKSSSAKLMPAGSILFSSRAPIGYTVIANNEICTNQGFKNIVPYIGIYNEFIYYFLKSAKKIVEQFASGTTFKEISGSKFGKILIKLPPLNEQKRIVEKIEAEFEKIDEGIEKLKFIRIQVQQYRQSVLSKYFNYDCNFLRLGSCFEVANGDRGKNYPSKNKLHRTGIPFVSAININNSQLKEDNLCCLTNEQYDLLGNGKINSGDTLLCIRGSIGKHCRYYKNRGAIASSMVILRKAPNEIQNQFLHYYLDSNLFRSEVKKYDNGTAQPNLSASGLKKFVFPNIDIKEQQKIVEEIEKRFEVADEVAKVVNENLEKAEQLKQSILKKAFEGRLVPQDLTDEPASVLLERIRKERNNAK